MASLLDKLKKLRNDLGPANALLYLLNKAISVPTVGRAKIERFLFFAQPVHDRPWLPSTRGGTSIARQLHPADPLLGQVPRPQEVIAERYAQGAICLGVIRNDTLQAYLWLVHDHYDEDVVRVRFVLPPSGNAVWDFDVYVAPAYRLGYSFLRLWDSANTLLRARGVRWSISRISAFNMASLASHVKLGARPIGSATFLVVGPLQIMVSNLSPRISISFGQHRPQLLMPGHLE